MSKERRKHLQKEFKPGDYIIRFVEDDIVLDELNNLKDCWNLYKCDKEDSYINEERFEQIIKCDKGYIHTKENNNTEEKKWYYFSQMQVIPKEIIDKLFLAYPPKYKTGDKLNNPFKKFTAKTLNAYEEELKIGERLRSQPLEFLFGPKKGIRSKIKKIPYLPITSVDTFVLYNFKYKKVLFKLIHRYHVETPEQLLEHNGGVGVYGSIEQSVATPYANYNDHWSELCSK